MRPLLRAVRRALRALLAAPRRRLRPTRAGKWILGIAVALGLAAFNTGNNLLFFGWGLSLSAILVSGLLSESTLRSVSVVLGRTGELRVGQRGGLAVRMTSASARMPAFGVEVAARVRAPRAIDLDDDEPGALLAGSAYELRLSPGESRDVDVDFVPRRRGAHSLTVLEARTAYPFGFFEKARTFPQEPAPRLVVLPARVDVAALARTLLSRLGEAPSRRVGAGDELFGLRPFRQGDDPRRIAWRRTARTGRAVVREDEAASSRDVLLDLVLPSSSASSGAIEDAIASCASLAEDLLAAQHAVGLRAPGVLVEPAPGARQRSALLVALALLDPRAPVPDAGRAGRSARVAVVGAGQAAPSTADQVVRVGAVHASSTTRPPATEAA